MMILLFCWLLFFPSTFLVYLILPRIFSGYKLSGGQICHVSMSPYHVQIAALSFIAAMQDWHGVIYVSHEFGTQ